MQWFDDHGRSPTARATRPAPRQWMDFVYDPENAARITEYVQYISPVKGVQTRSSSRAATPPAGREPADLPPTRRRSSGCSMLGGRSSRTSETRGPDALQRHHRLSRWPASRPSAPQAGEAGCALRAAAARAALAAPVLRRPDVDAAAGRRCRCTRARRVPARLRVHLGVVELHRRVHRLPAEQILRSFATPARPRSSCILIGYPLAYFIAFKAGRWQEPAARPGDGAVLLVVPDPHHRLEDDPRPTTASVARTLLGDHRPSAADGRAGS